MIAPMKPELPKQRSLVVIDDQTGEALELEVRQRPRNTTKGEYSMIHHPRMIDIASDRRYQGIDFRILMVMIGHMDFGGRVTISPGAIAKKLGIKPQNVYRSLTKLRQNDLILQLEDSPDYYMNPLLAQRGKNIGGQRIALIRQAKIANR